MKKNKRVTPKWVTNSYDYRYDEVCGWNSIQDMASCLAFYHFFWKIWPWSMTFIDTWIIECAWLGSTTYEVCRGNSIRDMASFLPWPLSLTFGQGHHHVGNWTLMGCSLVPIMESVGEITSNIWPVVEYFTHFWEILTLTFERFICIILEILPKVALTVIQDARQHQCR